MLRDILGPTLDSCSFLAHSNKSKGSVAWCWKCAPSNSLCGEGADGSPIAVICVTKSRTGDYDFRACARARGFRGSTFSVGRIRFAVCAERSRDKTCVF